MKKKRFLGFGFADEVIKVTGKFWHFKRGETSDWTDLLLPNFHPNSPKLVEVVRWRVTVLTIISLGLFFIIFLRIFHLQIVAGRSNRELADGNRIQVKVIHAPRGVIFDRNGQILAANAPAFRLFDKNSHKARLISREEALDLEVKNDPQAQDLEIDNVRTYPDGERLAHVVGYVGEISPQELKKNELNYRSGDRVGKSGIEAQYEKFLRGTDGGEIIEVDSAGHKLRSLRRESATAGQNVYLTIDAKLQEKTYQLMQETLSKVGSCCAAAAAFDPKTGQVLTLISLPSFDPNILTKAEDESAIQQVFSQTDSPILNRVIAGVYPPGSTFKPVTSLAALASGKITADTIIEDTGVIYLGSFKFSNWYFNQYGKVEGPVNLVTAIKRSTDTYFYRVGQIIGEQALIDWAKKLNLGAKLGIDLPGEEVGLIPDDGWKRKNFGESWYPGDTLHMAIGQGFLLTTPLQILGLTAFVAADGVLYQPQLIYKVVNKSLTVYQFKPKILLSNLTSANNIKVIKQGLSLVPQTGGTAWPFFTFPISTGGKTGTAEYGDAKGRTHAWYTSYAPASDPKIAMTILVEGGGEGSNVAAPIAKETYRWYFSPDKNKLIQDVYTQATESAKTLGE